MAALIESPHLVRPGESIDLANAPTDARHLDLEKSDAKAQAGKLRHRLDELQEVLFAQKKHAILIVLQSIDAGGKDSTIRKVFGRMNPQGVRVHGFGVPTPVELSHDFLWRYHEKCPPKGFITIFNRSHYEGVLVERVRRIVPEDVWQRRYEQINQWEKMLASEGTLILKFFLHISRQEQAKRFRKRLERPDKWWKFSENDLEERQRWKAYQQAFQEALERCSTEWAPWYAVPADQKRYRNLVVGGVVTKAMEALDLSHPEPPAGMDRKIQDFLKALD